MLKRILAHQEIVKSVFIYKFPNLTDEQRSSLANVYIDHDGWELMQAIHDVLEPLELATRALSGKYYGTLGLAHITIAILRYGLTPRDQDSAYSAALKKSLLSQFKLYSDFKMAKIQKELMLVRFKRVNERIIIFSP